MAGNQCFLCDKTFTRPGKVKIHMKEVHGNTKDFEIK